MNTTQLFILIWFLIIIGCNLNKDTILSNKAKRLNVTDAQISPSEVSGCKVKAKIISIDTLKSRNNPDSPCSKNPCIANIKIEEIIKMGALCGPMLYQGAELKVYFAFTLSETTKELFPDLIAHYPGLKKNDTFVTSIETRSEKNEHPYQAIVYTYEKIE
ncbi:MAG TPA: hypothetical protein EYM84_09885 [Flavobacteriales bacterium]|nr:hypothetical protein [Flavobacteriales bacterium]